MENRWRTPAPGPQFRNETLYAWLAGVVAGDA